MIYLDNNATTQVAPTVAEAMQLYFTQKYGNASSMYPMAAEAHKAMEEARAKVPKVTIRLSFPPFAVFRKRNILLLPKWNTLPLCTLTSF